MHDKPKVVAVVGPTASGKTSLAIELAKTYHGEVISADSRQVYRGLDLGTGKVTREEMDGIRHHLLDVAEPKNIFTANDFKHETEAVLEDIVKRKKLPIVAGGTFFYLDLLRGKLQAAPVPPDEEFRQQLADLSNATLHEQLFALDPVRAGNIDPHNRRRLIRALEVARELGTVPEQQETESPYEWLLIGLEVEKEQLHQNIHDRLLQRIEAGMIEEAEQLHQNGLSYERMEALGLEYRYQARYLQGHITKEEMINEIETKTKQFAKRQLTWLKRDECVEWYTPLNREAILNRVRTFLHP